MGLVLHSGSEAGSSKEEGAVGEGFVVRELWLVLAAACSSTGSLILWLETREQQTSFKGAVVLEGENTGYHLGWS